MNYKNRIQYMDSKRYDCKAMWTVVSACWNRADIATIVVNVPEILAWHWWFCEDP